MAEKLKLIAFNQYKIGGVQSFYLNILSNINSELFEINWIFINNPLDTDPKPLIPFNVGNVVVFDLNPNEHYYSIAKRLDLIIDNNPGIILTNFDEELVFLHLYERRKKTIVFICHDEYYLHRARKYNFIIDVFIAHNSYFFDELKKMYPNRIKDIYFIPYGVKILPIEKRNEIEKELKLVIAARLQIAKGIYDLPIIDNLITSKGFKVNWTIIGDGPEKESLMKITNSKSNFTYKTIGKNEDVINEMSNHDIFILPSRLEGLPVSMLEAMSVGCVPVIALFNDGIKEIVTNDIGYIQQIGDNIGFANAIEKLHNNRDDLKIKSHNSRKLVSEFYNIEIQAKKYSDLFMDIYGYKIPSTFKFIGYNGYKNHPWIPSVFQYPLLLIKKIFF